MSKLARGNGDLGTRAAPARSGNNDKKIGGRLDFGPKIIKNGQEYRKIFFQLNKDADDSTIKKLADKNSHQVWSEADIPIKEQPSNEEAAEIVDDVFTQLDNNMK
jgi:hypothetical protein